MSPAVRTAYSQRDKANDCSITTCVCGGSDGGATRRRLTRRTLVRDDHAWVGGGTQGNHVLVEYDWLVRYCPTLYHWVVERPTLYHWVVKRKTNVCVCVLCFFYFVSRLVAFNFL